MASVTLSNTKLRGIVCAVPGPELTVADIGKAFASDVAAKVAKLVGLECLHRAKPGLTTADLVTSAAQRLLQQMLWQPETIDGVVLVTQTPDYFLPNTASVVHANLRLPKSCFAFDVAIGCPGFVYGLWIAAQFIHGGAARRMLLLVGDTLSQIVSPEDHSGMLFGDAATALALEWDPTADPSSFVVGADGAGAKNIVVPAGAFRTLGQELTRERTPDEEGNARSPYDFYMNGWEVFNFTAREVPGLLEAVLQQHGWTRDDVDIFFLHQANKMMIEHLIRKCHLPRGKAPINIGRYGNTSGVSIPLLISDDAAGAVKSGPVRAVMTTFGVGYAWAAAALTVGPLSVAEVVNIQED